MKVWVLMFGALKELYFSVLHWELLDLHQMGVLFDAVENVSEKHTLLTLALAFLTTKVHCMDSGYTIAMFGKRVLFISGVRSWREVSQYMIGADSWSCSCHHFASFFNAIF